MSIVSRKEIVKRLAYGVSDPRSLVVTPLLRQADAIDVDAVDLRLGSYFLLPRVSHQPYVCPDKESGSVCQHNQHVPLGRYLVVPAHQTVLGVTLEYIKLPYDVAGQILTKSSIARAFVVVETAPWIHPNYRGCLTIEIANVSNTPLLLYPGRTIAQLVLMMVHPKPARRDALPPKYLGPVLPEAAEFNDPAEDLKLIGVDHVWTIKIDKS